MRMQLEELFRYVAEPTFHPSYVAVALSDSSDTFAYTGEQIVDFWEACDDKELPDGETPLSQGLRELLRGQSANDFEVFIWTPQGIANVTLTG